MSCLHKIKKCNHLKCVEVDELIIVLGALRALIQYCASHSIVDVLEIAMYLHDAIIVCIL